MYYLGGKPVFYFFLRNDNYSVIFNVDKKFLEQQISIL